MTIFPDRRPTAKYTPLGYAFFILFAIYVIAVCLIAYGHFSGMVQERVEYAEAMPTPEASPVVIAWPDPNYSQRGLVTYLSNADRAEIERTLMVECGGEPYIGVVAVAQCTLDAAQKDGIAPVEVLTEYKYTKARKAPSQSVREAMRAVYDRGERAIEQKIFYFANPRYCDMTFHKTRPLVAVIGNHNFYS
jgi:spore germination cell wall hydrolase CwlJ-like protein